MRLLGCNCNSGGRDATCTFVVIKVPPVLPRDRNCEGISATKSNEIKNSYT